jgi:hypothetical protein
MFDLAWRFGFLPLTCIWAAARLWSEIRWLINDFFHGGDEAWEATEARR